MLADCIATGNCTETDLLKFIHNIKCLEAGFYSCASTGQYLDPALTRNGPQPTSETPLLLLQPSKSYYFALGSYSAELPNPLSTLCFTATGGCQLEHCNLVPR